MDSQAIGDNGVEQELPIPLIMVVDDIVDNHKVLGNILRKKGYKIAPATSGIRALEMMTEVFPDLILLDIMMPDMNGFEVCKKIKEMPAAVDIPIIFLSAKAEIENILEGFSLGAVDYVTKPFQSAELLMRVQTHLRLKFALDRERHLIETLSKALNKVKRLSGMLPICSQCKKIRDHQGNWHQVEEFIDEHSEAHFSHSVCPNCVTDLYPEMAENVNAHIHTGDK